MNNNLIDQFIDYYWLTSGASKNTLSAYRSDLNIFNKWLNQKPFTSVDKKLVQDYHIDHFSKVMFSNSYLPSLIFSVLVKQSKDGL